MVISISVEDIAHLKKVLFTRCVVPERQDGTWGCRLVADKERVSPLRKLSLPRLELQCVVAGVRLVSQVEHSLAFTSVRGISLQTLQRY
jgi:hypothetical protein